MTVENLRPSLNATGHLPKVQDATRKELAEQREGQGNNAPPLDVRGQKLIGDFVGNDEANAIADTIAFKCLQPPFVVGILGGSGSGKSFTFNLIKERLKEIQKYDLANKDVQLKCPYVGHLYFVKFDVWTFAKDNLLSSLMYQILTELNDQLDLEAVIGPELIMKGVSVIEVMDQCTSGEIKYLRYLKDALKVQSVKEGIRKWEPIGGQITEALVKATNSNYEFEVKQLEEKKRELEAFTKEFEEQKDKKKQQLAWEYVISEKNTSTPPEIKRLLKDAYHTIYTLYYDDDGEVPQTVDAAMDNMKWRQGMFGRLKTYCVMSWVGSLSLPTPIWYTLFLSSLTILFPLILGKLYVLAIASVISVLSGLYAKYEDAKKKLKSAQEEINKVASEIQLDEEQLQEALKAAKNSLRYCDPLDEENQQDVMKLLNAEINYLKDRLWLKEGDFLHKVVGDRLKSSYERRGVVHQAQVDVKRMSDAMLSSKQKQIFPRGDPRIVLFIDDLDRCPPRKVVETLEAVQLLARTKLFVVVLAVDVQYVTLCVEKEYKDILDPKRHKLSGLDYIEKIIQLPYRVPPISAEYRKSYLQEQMNARRKKIAIDESTSPRSKDDNDNQSQEQQPRNEPVLPFNVTDQADSDNEGPSLGTAQSEPEEPLVAISTEELKFTGDELDMLEHVCVLCGVDPRGSKRLVNVFKLMKIIWYRWDQSRDGIAAHEFRMREASVLMLTLCKSDSKRVHQGMCEVLAKVEQTQSMPSGCNNLKDFIKETLGERVPGQAKDMLLTMIDDEKCSKILDKVVWKSGEEWNLTKKALRLVRSFSFLEEYNEPVDDIQHYPTQQIIDATQGEDDSVQKSNSAGRIDTIRRINEVRETRVKFEKDLESCRQKRKEIELKYAENEKKKVKKLQPIDEEIDICKSIIKELKSTLVKYAKELNALGGRSSSSSSSSDDSGSDNDE